MINFINVSYELIELFPFQDGRRNIEYFMTDDILKTTNSIFMLYKEQN